MCKDISLVRVRIKHAQSCTKFMIYGDGKPLPLIMIPIL